MPDKNMNIITIISTEVLLNAPILSVFVENPPVAIVEMPTNRVKPVHITKKFNINI